MRGDSPGDTSFLAACSSAFASQVSPLILHFAKLLIISQRIGHCRVILAQLEGSGRGALAAYNQEQYTTLFNHLHDVPLNEPDRWLEQLMRKDKALGTW